MFKQTLIGLLCCGFLPAQTKPPERKVEEKIITSERDPEVRIRLPKSVRYVGADRWVLYGIADCELHAFVEAMSRKIFSGYIGYSLKATFRRCQSYNTNMIHHGLQRWAAWIST